MKDQLEHYIELIGRMRTDSGKSKYPVTTRHRAPHKPILLLAIFDLLDQAALTTNFRSYSPRNWLICSSYIGRWSCRLIGRLGCTSRFSI